MSRRRRPNPPSSSKRPAASPAPHTARVESQQEQHRLAVIASDNGGSVGSALTLFEQALATVAKQPEQPAALSPDAMRTRAEKIQREIAEATELAEAATLLRDAELRAEVVRRRLQRTVAAERARLNRERRRAEGGFYVNQARSDGRPTRLAVDAGAWDVVKSQALRRRMPISVVVARLVADAVRHNTLPRAAAEDRCVTQRFVRLVGLDVDGWSTFRAMARDAHVTSTRMVGLLVEADARRLGWKPQRGDAV